MMMMDDEYQCDLYKYLSNESISCESIDSDRLNYIDEKVLKYSRNFLSAPEFPIICNSIVIAKCIAWNKWFRARVLQYDRDMDSVKVLAIDYGHKFVLPRHLIFPLVDEQLAQVEPIHPIHSDEQSPAAENEINIDEMKAGIFSSTKMDFVSSQSIGVESDIVLTNGDASVSQEQSEQSREVAGGVDTSVTTPPIGTRRTNWLNASKSNSLESDSAAGPSDDILENRTDNPVELTDTNPGSASSMPENDENSADTMETVRDEQSSTAVDKIAGNETPSFEQDRSALPNDSVPLKELSLIDTKTICVGAEATRFQQSKCYKHFLPWIADQLNEMPRTYRLQEIAWPQLMEGRSAIIIDPSDNLADLLYLPVISTHVENLKRGPKRNGPLAIIVCKNQERCIEIAKRCLNFSSGGYMANRTICYTEEDNSYVSNEKFKNCNIFVTSIFHFIRYGFDGLKKFDSVRQIVFDEMDNVNHKLFQDIMKGLKKVPEQIILTSRFWTAVLKTIYNSQVRYFLICGAPLDIAIAAQVKFDALFLSRISIIHESPQKYKLDVLCERIVRRQFTKCLIICDDMTEVKKVRAELKSSNTQFESVTANFQLNEWKDCYYRFVRDGIDIYFCHSKVMSSVDMSNFSYFVVNKMIMTDARNRPEIARIVKGRLQSMIKPKMRNFGANAVTIAFFCFEDLTVQTRLLAKSFCNYQWQMKCSEFWSHLSTLPRNILPFAHDLCLEFQKYSNLEHLKSCSNRHKLIKEDGPQLCGESFLIIFRILYFYSPVHFKVAICAPSEPDSQTQNVEIFLAQIIPCNAANVSKHHEGDIFRRIFNRMREIDGHCDWYKAKIFLKLNEIYFAEDIVPSNRSKNSFIRELYPDFEKSHKIMNQLKRMASEFTANAIVVAA